MSSQRAEDVVDAAAAGADGAGGLGAQPLNTAARDANNANAGRRRRLTMEVSEKPGNESDVVRTAEEDGDNR
jgi:hypothetical protein